MNYICYLFYMKSFILLSTLLLAVLALVKLPISELDSPVAHLGQLEEVQIFKDEIFYLLKNHKKFGYLKKSEPKLQMAVQLDEKQRFVGVTFDQLNIIDGNRIKKFTISAQTLAIKRPLEKVKDLIQQKILNFFGAYQSDYLLTNNYIIKWQDEKLEFLHNRTNNTDERKLEFKSMLQLQKKVVKKELSEDQIKQLRSYNHFALIYTLLSKESFQICIKLFENDKQAKTQCYPVGKDSQFVSAYLKNENFFLIFSDVTYVIDLTLKIKSKLKEKIMAMSQKSAVLEGGSSFILSKNAVYDNLIFSTQQAQMIELKEEGSKYLLKQVENERKICEIEKINNLQPLYCWGSEKQNDKAQLDLLIQWSDLSISFYQINAEKAVQSIWRIIMK